MALQKQSVPVDFTGGVDTKTNPKLVIPGKFTKLENCVYRDGTPRKRYGCSALGTTGDLNGTGTTTLASGEGLCGYEDQLLRMNNDRIWSYASGRDRWERAVGVVHPATISTDRLVRSVRTQRGFDHATANGVTVTAWIELDLLGGGYLFIQAQDEATGAVFWRKQAASSVGIAGASQMVRVVVASLGGSTYIHVYASYDGNINCGVIEVTSGVSVLPPTMNVCAAFADPGDASWDAVAMPNGRVFLAYLAGGVTGAVVAANTGGVSSGPSVLTAIASDGVWAGSTTNGDLYAIFHDSGANSVKYLVVSSTLAAVLGVTVIQAGPVTNIAPVESTTNTLTCFMDRGGTVETFSLTRTAVSVAAAALAGNPPLSLGLITGAFMFDGVPTVGIRLKVRSGASATTQHTALFVDANGVTVGRCLAGLADIFGGFRLGNVITTGAGQYAALFSERGRLAYDSRAGVAQDITPRGITRVNLALTTFDRLPRAQIGDTLFIGGACPRVYDGLQVVEHGFTMYPEGMTATLAAGGGLLAGQYEGRAVYSWLNARGELVRSAPGPAVTFTATAGQKVTLACWTLPLSQMDNSAAGAFVQVEFYLTQANGTLFYKVSTADTPVQNDVTAATVSFDFTASDASIASNELLYTTGGVLDASAVPPYKFSAVFKDRLVMAGLEDPYEFAFTTKRVKGEQPRCNDAFRGRVPADTGVITGVAVMDDKLILATEKTFYVVLGDGPDALGQGSFGDPQRIQAADEGCSDFKSLVATPDGVMFRGGKGFSLLTRALEVAFVGADVDSYGDYTCRAATLRADVNEVWIQVDQGSDATGLCLVFSYEYKTWSVIPSGFGATDACLFGGVYYRARSNGKVLKETPGAFLDEGVGYGRAMETGWFALAGRQGFQRLYQAEMLGTWASDCILTVEVAYDYQAYNAFDSVQILNGSGQYVAGGPFQARRKMRVQKCEAVRFRFTETNPSGGSGGVDLDNLSLELGIRPGLYRGLSAAKSV